MIRIKSMMGDILTSSIFHVIDAETSYKLLVGRPWLHKQGIAASTLHQCLKYYLSGERKINSNVKSFTKTESHFVDVRFFEADDAPKKTTPSTIASKGKGGTKNVLQAPNEDMPIHQLKKEQSKQRDTSSSVMQVDEKVATSIESASIVLRYIPKLQ